MKMEKKIAVITTSNRLLRFWCEDNNIPIDNCIMVNKIDHIRGRIFSEVRLGYQYDFVDPDICERAKFRIK